MGRIGSYRRLLGAALTLVMLAGLTVPAFAQDEAEDAEEPALISAPEGAEDRTWEGAYAVVGTTNTGKQVSTTVIVRGVGDDRIQLQAKVMGFPVTSTGQATWTGGDQVTVPVSVWVLGVADGSGTVTLTRTGSGWDLSGSGTGQVLRASGSATVSGSKPADFGAPPELAAEAAGISGTAQSIDEATGPLQPEAQPAIDTGDVAWTAATILILAFVLILLEMILGVVFL